MLKKIQNVMQYIIVGFFCISIIYFIFIALKGGVSDISEKSSAQKTILSNENVNIYVDEANLVKDYSTFFTIEGIVNKVIDCLNSDDYKKIKSISASNFASSYGFDFNDKLLEYTRKNFNIANGYKNSANLEYLYKAGNEYIAIVKSLQGSTKVGLKLNSNGSYIITYMDM